MKKAGGSPVTLLKNRCVYSKAGCWIWTGGKGHGGYGTVTIGNEKWGTHRLSFHLFIGPIPPDLMVCHHCDNPECCEPSHLFLGTAKDNMLDAIGKGKMRWNEESWFKKGREHPRWKDGRYAGRGKRGLE